MTDSTLPTAGTHKPGHVPFYLRVRQARLTLTPRHVRVLRVEEQLITVLDGTTTEILWTHAPTAQYLAVALEKGKVQLERLGSDIFIANGYMLSLVDEAHASRCIDPEDCGRGVLKAIRTGKV